MREHLAISTHCEVCLLFEIPPGATQYGFTLAGLGSHASRTMMLAEISLLLAACPPTATFEDYRHAILVENALRKQTDSTRIESLRRLRELYSIQPDLLIFRALRELWPNEVEAQPLLALLCVLGRDPILRMTTGVLLAAAPGEAVNAEMLSRAVKEQYSEPLNAMSLGNIGRHVASTWTQSGHLSGRSRKTRRLVQPAPVAVAYALLLGHLCGVRGAGLFATPWAQVLDASEHTLRALAVRAAQQGWLEYRHAGQVTEITFRHLTQASGTEAALEHP